MFRCLNASCVAPRKKFAIVVVECSGYDCTTFSQSDFNNMCRNDHGLISGQDVDLVVERFKDHKCFNPAFFYFLLKDESSKPLCKSTYFSEVTLSNAMCLTYL